MLTTGLRTINLADFFGRCKWCGRTFPKHYKTQLYCHKKCKIKSKNYRTYQSERRKDYIASPEMRQRKKRYDAEWRKKNREKYLAYQKGYRLKKKRMLKVHPNLD